MAEPVGASSGRQLFKYDLGGSGSPHISVSPTSFEFPQTTVGDTSHTTVTVSNIGNADLDVTNITFNNSVFSSPAGSVPFTVPPGVNHSIQVDFHPAAFQFYTGVMTIESNDVVTPAFDVDLSGQGVVNGPSIVLSASNHNFGNVWVNGDGNAYWSFNISNTGDSPLEISDMHFNLPEFSFESEAIPFQIAAAETATVRLRFTPTQSGSYNDTLFIQSNDIQIPVVNVSVSGNGVIGNYQIGYQFWSFQVPDNPRVSYQEHRVIGLKPINDINGDGLSDVIIATNNYFIMALDGAGGGITDTLWTLNTFFNNSNAGSIGQSNDYGVQDAIAIVSDLNGDGKNDVVIGTGGGNEHVYALDGMNGHIIWGFGDDYNYSLGDFEAVDGQRDFNGDGVPDILAIADGNEQGTGYHSAYLFNGVNGNILWQYYYPGPYLAFGKTIISVNDVTGDGIPDAVIDVGNNGTTDLNVICLNGTNGQAEWMFPVTGYEPKELLELTIPGQTSDVVASQYFGHVYRIDGETGAQVWDYDYGFTGMIQITKIRDINGDNIDDILIAAFSGGVICLSGANGQALWSYPMNYQYGVAAVPDLNNDGIDDMITGDQDGTFYCISGSGDPLFFSHTFAGDRIYTVNALPSIDGMQAMNSL
jgi:outer membrane protein assembly factor BamB